MRRHLLMLAAVAVGLAALASARQSPAADDKKDFDKGLVQLFNGKISTAGRSSLKGPATGRSRTRPSSARARPAIFSAIAATTRTSLPHRGQDQRQGQQRPVFPHPVPDKAGFPRATRPRSTAPTPTRRRPAACTQLRQGRRNHRHDMLVPARRPGSLRKSSPTAITSSSRWMARSVDWKDPKRPTPRDISRFSSTTRAAWSGSARSRSRNCRRSDFRARPPVRTGVSASSSAFIFH